MSDVAKPVYRPSESKPSWTLRQGEILSDIWRYRPDPRSAAGNAPTVIRVHYPYAVIITQDCDIVQQKRWSSDDGVDLLLPSILLAELTTARQLRDRDKDKNASEKEINSKTWDRIRQNRDERYHFLETIPPDCDSTGQGIEELGIDFKRYFAVPTDELYALIDAGTVRRRCILNSPYMEHLCHRFLAYIGRIALPGPHRSEPSSQSAG